MFKVLRLRWVWTSPGTKDRSSFHRVRHLTSLTQKYFTLDVGWQDKWLSGEFNKMFKRSSTTDRQQEKYLERFNMDLIFARNREIHVWTVGNRQRKQLAILFGKSKSNSSFFLILNLLIGIRTRSIIKSFCRRSLRRRVSTQHIFGCRATSTAREHKPNFCYFASNLSL